MGSRTFFEFGEQEDAPYVCAHVDAPNVGDTVRFYTSRFYGAPGVKPAPPHLAVDGMPWHVTNVSRAVSRNRDGEWQIEATAKMKPGEAPPNTRDPAQRIDFQPTRDHALRKASLEALVAWGALLGAGSVSVDDRATGQMLKAMDALREALER